MKIGYKQSTAEGLVKFLNGAAQGAENYAQGKRYRERRADDRQDAERSYSLRLSEDARQNEANRRANEDSQREAQAFGPRQDALKERTRTERLQNDQFQADSQRFKTQQDFEDQVETDSHRQSMGQEYRRITGKDMPDEFYQSDSQGHKPGEMGWHWSQYDIRSDIPIKTQIEFNRQASELSTLPPGATREQRAAALRRDTQKAIIGTAKQDILDEIGSHLMPDAQPGAKAEEADPSLYVPKEKLEEAKKIADDETSKPDDLRRWWETVKKSHAQEVAQGEARQIAVEGLDMHAQRLAQQQADYGDLSGKIDPQAFEDFRTMRHRIADSKLSGAALQHAVEEAKARLTPGPKPTKQNDKTGFNAGEALKAAMQEAQSLTSPLKKAIDANPDQQDAIIQARAAQLLRMAQGLAGGDMPGQASGSGSHPNTPEDQARAAQAVGAQGGTMQSKAPDPAQAAELKKKAEAAGWTKQEFITFGHTGQQPAGKPPIQ